MQADTNGPAQAAPRCDCHVTLTRAIAGEDGYGVFADRLGFDRAVLIQAGPDFTERQRLIDTLTAHRSRARGVAAVSLITPDATLDQLHLLGVRGMAIDLSGETPGDAGVLLVEMAARGLRRAHWHVELDLPPALLAAIAPAIALCETPVVISHMAGANAGLGSSQPGLDETLDLLAAGRVWVKLSAITAVGTRARAWRDALPIMRALIGTNDEQLVWGSNWPNHGPDDAALSLLAEAARDEAVLRRILVENPARLYDFPLSNAAFVG